MPSVKLPYGHVVGRFLYVVGDTSADQDRFPDALPAKGAITLRPVASALVIEGPTPATAIPRPVELRLDDEGYVVDPAGARGVWVIAGRYVVEFKFVGVAYPSLTIDVTTSHVEASPLDLSLAAPIPETPSVRFVVNEQVYRDTLAASAAAELAKARAERARDEVLEAESPAGVARLIAGLSLAQTRPVRIAGIGSSTMRGFGAATDEAKGFNRIIQTLQRHYPAPGGVEAPVVAHIEGAWSAPSSAPGVQGYNAAKGGTDSTDFAPTWKLNAIAALQPFAVLTSIGAGDLANKVPVSTFRDKVRTAIEHIDAGTTIPPVHVFIHQHRRLDTNGIAEWSEYRDALADIVAEDPSTRVLVDLDRWFRPLGIPGKDPYKLILPDKIHLTDEGYAVFADFVLRAIAPQSSVAPRAAPVAPLPPVTPDDPLPPVTPDDPLPSGTYGDTFSRADGPLVGQAIEVGGSTWKSRVAGTANPSAVPNIGVVAGGMAGPGTVGANNNAFVFFDAPDADMVVTARIGALADGPGARGGGIAFRVGDNGQGLWLSTRYDYQTDGYALYSIPAGAGTLITGRQDVVPKAGDEVKVSCKGADVSVYVNDALLFSTVATSTVANKGVGFHAHQSGTGLRLDRIEVQA